MSPRKVFSVGGAPVGRVAFGAEQLGGYAWGKVDISAIEHAVAQAVKSGVTFFDTADCYGRGESEIRLGRELAGLRRHAFVATKFGVRFDQQNKVFYDNRPEYAERALEGSLERLGTDYVDLFQLHWPDGHTPLVDIFERLERLREDGRIRWYGVTNVPPATIDALSDQWPGFASFSAEYSLAHRNDAKLIRTLCVQRGLTFLSWGSLAQGLLSGKYDKYSIFDKEDRRASAKYAHFHGEKLVNNLTLVDKLHEIASSLGDVSPAQVAIRFVLEDIPHSIAIVGVKDLQQFEVNIRAQSVPFNQHVFEQLDQISS